MSDGNPPESWYDPPECPYELNARRKIEGEICYVCAEPAVEEIEIRDMRIRYGEGDWVAICDGHKTRAVEKYLEQIHDYEPEYEKED